MLDTWYFFVYVCMYVWQVECVASACSLHETLLRMAMEEDSIDAHAIGRSVL